MLPAADINYFLRRQHILVLHFITPFYSLTHQILASAITTLLKLLIHRIITS